MRRSRKVPLVSIDDGAKQCCGGVLSLSPDELALSRAITYGTTAWRISMGRRQVVESVNAALKGGFVDLSRGFFRVFGRTKITVLLGFTLAAFNLDRIRSFRAKLGEVAGRRRTRARRRLGTWRHLVDAPPHVVPARASHPPPG